MKDTAIISSSFACGGYTSGSSGIWTRNAPSDPPTKDYISLSERLGTPLSDFVRPYQAGGDKVSIVGAVHGGSGIIRDNDLKKTDGLVTAEKGLVLTVIAADCVPIYLLDERAGVIGLLHCGWRSAAESLISNGISSMRALGASPSYIHAVIGPHICSECYEVGEEVYQKYSDVFTEAELSQFFSVRSGRLHLQLSAAIRTRLMAESVPEGNISEVGECTYHDRSYYSYRRGDRGRQNLAFLMLRR